MWKPYIQYVFAKTNSSKELSKITFMLLIELSIIDVQAYNDYN